MTELIEVPGKLREKLARILALHKHGGTDETLYPHWIADAEPDADEILALIQEAGYVKAVVSPMVNRPGRWK